MTIDQKPEHGIKCAHIEPAVAHITFANELGMLLFLADNRQNIGMKIERWNVDFLPELTITPRN